MSDEIRAAIGVLQSGDDAHAQQAFHEIEGELLREPRECAVELSRAILDEVAAGGLKTPRLLTLLGMTREPAPECVSLCLDLLCGKINEVPSDAKEVRTDAKLGAAAIVARVNPPALVPDLGPRTDVESVPQADREIVQALPSLLVISSALLRELPDDGVTDMARWLWYDCAAFDLLPLVDLVSWYLQKVGADDPMVALTVDLVERVSAKPDYKKYAAQHLKEAGVSEEVNEELQTVHRAIRVAPLHDQVERLTIVDPEPPEPDPRVDESLATLAENDEYSTDVARIGIEQMFEAKPRPTSLTWWVAITVDALPPWRRREDIDWALTVMSVWRDDKTMIVPPSVLQRWLDTPQLLSSDGTRIALILLSQREPRVIVQQYLHRAVAASVNAAILMRGLWSELVATEPDAVLAVLSRWLAFGFGQNDFLLLLVELLTQRLQEQPELFDKLDQSLVVTNDMPEHAVDVARNVLKVLREQIQESQST